MMKEENKRTFEVDIAVTLFITQEVEATDEDEAQRIAEDSIKTGTVMNAWECRDCEIESTGCTEVEVE